MKIFGKNASVDFWDTPLKGLSYVAQHAKAGDIVNISWGGKWIGAARRLDFQGFSIIDQEVHVLASQGLKLVIAAGNAEENGSDFAWSELFIPGNEGAYPFAPSSNPGAGIYSIAAVSSSSASAGHWSDDYWKYSAFGNNPPNYAEPGVSIPSLWPAAKAKPKTPRTNTCSGTSFAAPAFAGLLVRQQTLNVVDASGDPSVPAKQVAFIDDHGGNPCP